MEPDVNSTRHCDPTMHQLRRVRKFVEEMKTANGSIIKSFIETPEVQQTKICQICKEPDQQVQSNSSNNEKDSNNNNIKDKYQQRRQLYLGNLAPCAKERELRKLLKVFGEIKDLKIKQKPLRTGKKHEKPSNYGYVEFEESSSALKLLQSKVSKCVE